MKILGALLRKEIKMMKRNPLIMRVIVMLPLMVMLVVPLIATMDVKNVSVIVIDNDRSMLSSRIIANINATEDIEVAAICGTQNEAMADIESGAGDVILTIPYEFSKTLSGLDVEANGVNATKGMLGAQYVISSATGTLRQWISEQGVSPQTIETSIINRYNPTLNFRNYMIPALMVVLIIIICGFLPALNLVSEKESGTIEAMNVTPVGKFTFVLSKLIPFWVIGIVVVTIGMIVGWLVYGLKPVGSVGTIYLASILFSLVMSGLGVTVANKSATMIQSIFIMFAFIMIFQLMSGLFTPISSMPAAARYFTYLIPPRYYIEIMRAVYLKGATIPDLTVQFASLGILAAALCTIATLTYKKQN